jgi:hypothetical protein
MSAEPDLDCRKGGAGEAAGADGVLQRSAVLEQAIDIKSVATRAISKTVLIVRFISSSKRRI